MNVSDILGSIMHVIAQNLMVPAMVVLLIMIIVAVSQLGSFFAEYFIERRNFKADIPNLLKEINHRSIRDSQRIIEGSRLLKSQRKALTALLENAEGTKASAFSLAEQLLAEEEKRYQKSLLPSEIICRLGPMFGLLGTLIPLGPGLMALGEGDIQALSSSMLVAFDTTISGIISAAVCYVIFNVRKRWYKGYISVLESLMETLIEKLYEDTRDTEEVSKVILVKEAVNHA